MAKNSWGDASRLGAWQNEPYVLDRVREAARTVSAGRSCFLAREVQRETRLPFYAVSGRLLMMVKKGELVRYKLPMTSHLPCPVTRKVIPYRATRPLWVYYWPQD